eukprot:scaffold8402_cov209-Skeletonema_marinoi.AAC.1
MENRHDPICGTDKYYYGEADRIRMDTVSTCKKVRFAQVNFKLPMAPKISLAQKKEQSFHLVKTKALRSCGHDDANSTATSPSPTTTTLAVGSEG